MFVEHYLKPNAEKDKAPGKGKATYLIDELMSPQDLYEQIGGEVS